MTNHSTFRLTISKVNEQLFSGDALSVTVPGTEGEMTILANHEPLITILKNGLVTVKTDSEAKTFVIEKGLLETSNGQVTVLVTH
jgi:F-type H+-transporting ATPase subunit epsilon